jgi:hypothetical protein
VKHCFVIITVAFLKLKRVKIKMDKQQLNKTSNRQRKNLREKRVFRQRKKETLVPAKSGALKINIEIIDRLPGDFKVSRSLDSVYLNSPRRAV